MGINEFLILALIAAVALVPAIIVIKVVVDVARTRKDVRDITSRLADPDLREPGSPRR